MSFLDYLGPFLLLLGVLVVIHELGHFVLAKWFGVQVERFSVGFGPSLLRRKLGETEYVLAWLPLGGYVKMLGEIPDEKLSPQELQRSFTGQSPGRRIAISLAGPLMNLLLPVLVIAGLLMTGWPTPTSRVGSVVPGSPAAEAGLRPGDRVVGVEGREVWRWQDLAEAVQAGAGKPLALEVERDDERLQLEVTPEPLPGGRGVQIGISPRVDVAMLGVPDPDTPAARAGLRTGDRVESANGEPVAGWYDLAAAVEGTSGPLELEIVRQLDGEEERARLRVGGPDAGPWTLEGLGAIRVDFVVLQVLPVSPARRAGLEEGDLVLAVNGEPVRSFETFAERIRTGGGAPLSLLVLRDGREEPIEVTPESRTLRVDGEFETTYAIGIHGGVPGSPGEIVDEVVRNPLVALGRGSMRTAGIVVMIVDGVRMLLTREVGVESLAGPIGIGELAGQSFAEEGWFPFLWMMCVISVNLAILNLLPIPILDGGHIIFALAEWVRGGPIGMRTREIAQTVGISLILLLMGFAFWNDISRHWSGILDFFKDLI